VLADEPTTALDVVVQRGILTMLMRLQRRMNNTVVVVSHDMGVHYQITHRMAIMYAGKVVELGATEATFKQPYHPYTDMLIKSLPRVGDRSIREGISGAPPSLINPPRGCRFAPRCPRVMPVCREVEPPMLEVEAGHHAACHLYDAGVTERKN
jgi:peptide/nickel transport system ATP-binding protein